MKANFLTAALGIFLISAPLISTAHKKNVTDAAMLMKKFSPMAIMDPATKKNVEEAKKFIDLAAANPETAEDMKMHLYRAQIYFALIELSQADVMKGGKVDETLVEQNSEVSKASFKKVMEDPKKSFKKDAEDFINMRSEMGFNMGIKSYNDKKFEQATQMFAMAYEVQKFLNVEYKEAYTNTTLSLNNYVDSLLKIKNYDKANEISESVLEIMPKNIDVIITLININLQKGDAVVAEKYLNKGLELDPKNKQLYYVLGTSYIDLKQNDKAEQSLNKALEIDPNYTEAQYQLGAHLFNWANELKYEAGQLDYKDPKVSTLEAQSKEVLGRALVVLEKYIEKNPNEKAVLDILYKTHYKLDNKEKAAEYKKRMEAIK
jgi:tetratricopeptide (TPR) repeat protein